MHFDRLTGDSRSRGLCFQKNLFLGPWFEKLADNYKTEVAPRPEHKALVNGVLSPAEVAAMLDLPDLSISLFPDGKTPQRVLAYAVAFGEPETVRTLLQSREDFDVNWAADGYPWIPLCTVCNQGSRGLLKLEVLLEQEGLNLYAPLNDKGDTLLHLLLRLQLDHRPTPSRLMLIRRMLSRLLKKGCDINCKNASGERPLHLATNILDRRMLWYFRRQSSIDLNAPDNHGRSPLHALCNNKSLDACYLETVLVYQTININALDMEERTPLDYLRSNTTSEEAGVMETLLIERGAKTGTELRMVQAASIHSASDGRLLSMYIYVNLTFTVSLVSPPSPDISFPSSLTFYLPSSLGGGGVSHNYPIFLADMKSN